MKAHELQANELQRLVIGEPRKRSNILLQYSKLKSCIRYTLLAKLEQDSSVLPAYQAFEGLVAKEFDENGKLRLRKDKCTPELMHQLRIAAYVLLLWKYLQFPMETLILAFIHDDLEDDGQLYSRVLNLYGERVAKAAMCVSKKFGVEVEGLDVVLPVTVDYGQLFEAMARCPIASIIKMLDRIDNIRFMLGVFSDAKKRSYISEVFRLFMPMQKQARLRFPLQEKAYELLKRHLYDLCDVYLGMMDEFAAREAELQNEIATLREQISHLTQTVPPQERENFLREFLVQGIDTPPQP